jgi:hypothetical protein
LLRFVTGITETEQTKEYKQSMFDVAHQIGLPSEMIELRHQIAHESALPPLNVLRTATEDSLKWLEKVYWKPYVDNLLGKKEIRASRVDVFKDVYSQVSPALQSFTSQIDNLTEKEFLSAEKCSGIVKDVVYVIKQTCGKDYSKYLVAGTLLTSPGSLDTIKQYAILTTQHIKLTITGDRLDTNKNYKHGTNCYFN